MNRQGPIRPRIGDRLGARGRRATRAAVVTWRRNGDRDVGFARIDLQLPTHDKIMRAGPDGAALLGWQTAAIIFGELYLTDGVIRRSQLPALLPGAGPPDERTIRLLIDLHLWDEVASDAWRVHDFDKHNKSRAERLADREADAERKRAAYRPKRKRPKISGEPRENLHSETKSSPHPNSAHISSTQLNSEEKKRTPPTPPSPGASEATESDPSALSLVKNSDTPKPTSPLSGEETRRLIENRERLRRQRRADAIGRGDREDG
jgi:hypothetical protein